ncbi:MAG TPA: apolipoprotein N-acyltransferase [Streptosporangiaceae bacterium]
MAHRYRAGLRRALTQPARYAVLVAGAVLVLAFPAPNLELLAWVGLVPGLLLMLAAPARREAAVRGWWFGTGYLLAAMYWLAPNLGPGLLLVAIVLGALWGGVGLAAWSTLRPPVTWRGAAAALMIVPSAWLVTEWLRSWQGFGGPWAVLGVSQWQHPAVLALAAVGGVWLVTFALVAANTGAVIAMVARGLAPRLVGCCGALLAVAAGPAAFALTAPSPAPRRVTIALVQPGLHRAPGPRVAASERLTAAAARSADLIVWGESSVGFDLGTSPRLRQRLQVLSASVGTQILASQDAQDQAGTKSKVAVLIGANGIDGDYVKSRLVPFGEYIPFRAELGWLAAISRAAPQNMATGNGAHVLQATLRGGRRLSVGVLICFESAFPDMSRYDADHGAQVIIYQTSDSTFQRSWALEQHASLGALRAAETGRPVVQAALTGDSAAFDPRGRLLAWAGPGDRGAVVVPVRLPPASARTPFDRLGDYVPLTALAIVVLAAAFGLGRRLRRGGVQPASGPGDAQIRILWTGGRAPDTSAPVPGVPDGQPGHEAAAGEP